MMPPTDGESKVPASSPHMFHAGQLAENRLNEVSIASCSSAGDHRENPGAESSITVGVGSMVTPMPASRYTEVMSRVRAGVSAGRLVCQCVW
jgi:hypothetical protein